MAMTICRNLGTQIPRSGQSAARLERPAGSLLTSFFKNRSSEQNLACAVVGFSLVLFRLLAYIGLIDRTAELRMRAHSPFLLVHSIPCYFSPNSPAPHFGFSLPTPVSNLRTFPALIYHQIATRIPKTYSISILPSVPTDSTGQFTWFLFPGASRLSIGYSLAQCV